MLCKDYGIHRYKPTLSKPGLGQGHKDRYGIVFDEGLRLDVLVEELIICGLKAVDEMNPVWEAQLLSHLKLTGKRIGFLINFNVPIIKKGIQRIII